MEKWRPNVPNQFLFVTDEGDRCTPGGIRKMFRRLAKASGIPKEGARVSPHTCRHYFAVEWPRNHPGDLAGLQRVLGHASIKTTQIYFERADDLGAVERQQTMESNWASRLAERNDLPRYVRQLSPLLAWMSGPGTECPQGKFDAFMNDQPITKLRGSVAAMGTA